MKRKNKQTENFQSMGIEELEKEIAVCKKQAKGLKIGKYLSLAFAGAGLGAYCAFLGVMVDKVNKENFEIAKLVETPKQEYILKASGELIGELKSETNLTPEILKDYSSKLDKIVTISDTKFVTDYANQEIKTQADEIYKQYNSNKYLVLTLAVGVGSIATSGISYVICSSYEKDKRGRASASTYYLNKRQADEKLSEMLENTMTNQDIQTELK